MAEVKLKMGDYCWSALVIVMGVGLLLTTMAWYIKEALELDSKSSIIAMGMMYITILLLLKTLPVFAPSTSKKASCFSIPGMDWMGISVMFGMLFFCKVILRHNTTLSIGQNMHLDTTILLMMLGYLVFFIIAPPLKEGQKRGPVMPWFRRKMEVLQQEMAPPKYNNA